MFLNFSSIYFTLDLRRFYAIDTCMNLCNYCYHFRYFYKHCFAIDIIFVFFRYHYNYWLRLILNCYRFYRRDFIFIILVIIMAAVVDIVIVFLRVYGIIVIEFYRFLDISASIVVSIVHSSKSTLNTFPKSDLGIRKKTHRYTHTYIRAHT